MQLSRESRTELISLPYKSIARQNKPHQTSRQTPLPSQNPRTWPLSFLLPFLLTIPHSSVHCYQSLIPPLSPPTLFTYNPNSRPNPTSTPTANAPTSEVPVPE